MTKSVFFPAVCAVGCVVFLILAQPRGSAVVIAQEGKVARGNISNWSAVPGVKGLEPALQYLSRTDLAALPIGRTDIVGDDMYVTVSEGETKPPEQVRFEAHRRYIDVQFVIRGQEAIGVAPASTLKTVEPYDAARDIEFFAAPEHSEILQLRPGDFAVFEPTDAHRPSLNLDGPHVSRKAVVKVAVAYRDRQRANAGR